MARRNRLEPMTCQTCNAKEAVVHLTERGSDGWRELHLCRACGDKSGIPTSDRCEECRRASATFWVTNAGALPAKTSRVCRECASRAGWQGTLPSAAPSSGEGSRELDLLRGTRPSVRDAVRGLNLA